MELLRSFSRLKRQRCFPESHSFGLVFREPDVPIITGRTDTMDRDDIFEMDKQPVPCQLAASLKGEYCRKRLAYAR